MNFLQVGGRLNGGGKFSFNSFNGNFQYGIKSFNQQRQTFSSKVVNTSFESSKTLFSTPNKNFQFSYRNCSQTITKDFSDLAKNRILTEEQENLITREKTTLNKLLISLQKLGANESEISTLKNGIKKLDELFLIVVVGEFNSGKTSFLNTILGKNYLKEGITPTTSKINVIKYSTNEIIALDTENPDIEYIKLPVDWLKEINLVDTPGTNAIITSHQKITEQFIPRSDLILFITSIDKVLSESERNFLSKIEEWNKKVIFVITKVDILTNPNSQIKEVKEFLLNNIPKFTKLQQGEVPPIFFISSKQQLFKRSLEKNNTELKPSEEKDNEKTTLGVKNNSEDDFLGNKERFEFSEEFNQFEQLEEYILKKLDPHQRSRLILENPIGVSERLIENYKTLLKDKFDLLGDDLKIVSDVQSQLDYFHTDMKKEYKYKQDRIENSLLQLQRRFENYVDDHVKLSNILYLFQESKLRLEFEKQVLGNTSIEIDQELNNLVDWLIDRNTKQFNEIIYLLNQRSNSNNNQSNVNQIPHFDTRQQILSNITFLVKDYIKGIDKEDEGKRLTELVKSTLLQAATGVGISLSAIAFFSLFIFDITGVIGASVASVCGLFIIPFKRSRIKKSFHKKIDELKEQLVINLSKQIEKEINDSSSKILEVLSPLSHYVGREKPKLEQLSNELKEISDDLNNIKESIQQLWKLK